MTSPTPAPARRPRRPRHAMRTIFADVAASTRIAPRMQRVTFVSDQLAGFLTPFPDQFVTLLFPLPHQEVPVIAPGFTWEEYQAMPEEVRPVVRNYTVRAYRPELWELDIDFVLHAEPGFGSAWAERATPGMHVGMWGPRVGYNPPPDVGWQLLVGDETALPAIGAILEALPPGARASVVVEVACPCDEVPLATAGEVDVTWIYRDAAGEAGLEGLLDMVRAREFPPGSVYAWGAGEIEATQAYGKYLRRERGLRTAEICAIGYWRRDG